MHRTNRQDMLYREAHGARIPALGFGTYQLKDEEARRSVAEALEIGYRHIDTAQAYGNEADVGAVVAASGIPRDELFITTKVWWEQLDHDGVKQSFQRSLDSLQTDYIDLLLIHWDNDAIPLNETLAVTRAACRLVLDPAGGQRLGELPAARDIALLVGPEGGLSDSELALARSHGFTGIGLGPRILRTETAAVAALAAVQTVWGDFV